LLAYLSRILKLPDLLKQKSYFLFGPRGTGKTILIDRQLDSPYVFDLLNTDTFGQLVRRPSALYERVEEHHAWVVVDEIQKLPLLLDEVQRLITRKQARVLLTGSSARKLKRGGANLLGGRAREAFLFPLVSAEIPQFDLLRYLNRGGLPEIYLESQDPNADLEAYVTLYLREEIQAEAVVRKLDAFVRFLEVMGFQSGKELHFTNISNDAGIPAKTVESYITVLKDTLVGFELPPFLRSSVRKPITRSKFYFMDVGVANHLAKRRLIEAGSDAFGDALEHFIIQEIRAYLSYFQKDVLLSYWRTTSQMEVDCIVGTEMALEIKATQLVQERHLKSLQALREEGQIKRYAIISRDPAPRSIQGIEVIPIPQFLNHLWKGTYF
jgi:predicted AAA+ superfamily ATPase